MTAQKQSFWREVWASRHLLLQLTLRDFKSRYAGSTLGLFWAFAQPLAMMTILWGVFSYGLKANAQEPGVPFVAWFFAASIAWNFFQDTTLTTSNAIIEYSFLVKKIDFKVRLLPVVKILSSLVIHLIFISILVGVLLINGYMPTWYWLQALYYMGCLLTLSLGLGWMLSALSVFTRDVAQIVGICIQFGFWVTPIIWNWRRSVPVEWQWMIKLNPIFYITEGYRNSFVYGLPISAQGLNATIYFWAFAAILLLVGDKIFSRLKPHFGDVL